MNQSCDRERIIELAYINVFGAQLYHLISHLILIEFPFCSSGYIEMRLACQ